MDANHRAKAKEAFIALSELGREVSRVYGKYLRDGVWELRVIFQHHQHRFLYSFWKDIIVVTNAFLKKSAKVPETEIERARKLMDEFIRTRGWEEL
jgi:phage-related protein